MPRYFISTKEMRYYWLIENGNLVRHHLDTNLYTVYLDILEDAPDGIMKHVKLYLENGNTLKCYLPFKPLNYFHISETESLFDGRFNS